MSQGVLRQVQDKACHAANRGCNPTIFGEVAGKRQNVNLVFGQHFSSFNVISSIKVL